MRNERIIVVTAVVVLSAIVLGTASGTPGRLIGGLLGADAPFSATSTATFGGKIWTIGRKSGAEARCIELRSPDGWSSLSCPAVVHAGKPILVETGGAGNTRFLYGDVLGAATKVRLVRADCSVEELPVSQEGTFFTVYDAATPSPYEAVAVGGGGRELSSFVVVGRDSGTLSRDPC